MHIEINTLANEPMAEVEITCATCKACCCRLEVMLFTDTGVPQRYIKVDKWGSETMHRLADGWCAALDRDTMLCSIYEDRPLVCREFEMGEPDCITERNAHM
jgi:Fe-S-cluster containining protein